MPTFGGTGRWGLGLRPAQRLTEIGRDYCALGAKLGPGAIVCIPIVARDGDTLIRPSARLERYPGTHPTLAVMRAEH